MAHKYFVACNNTSIEEFTTLLKLSNSTYRHVMELEQNNKNNIKAIIYIETKEDNLEELRTPSITIYKEKLLSPKDKYGIKKNINHVIIANPSYLFQYGKKQVIEPGRGVSATHLPTRISVRCFGYKNIKTSELLAIRAVITIYNSLKNKTNNEEL